MDAVRPVRRGGGIPGNHAGGPGHSPYGFAAVPVCGTAAFRAAEKGKIADSGRPEQAVRKTLKNFWIVPKKTLEHQKEL